MAVAVRVQQGGELRRRRRPAGEAPVSACYPAIRRAVRATLSRLDVTAGGISITLLDDGEIEEMNRRYLEHDAPTDVISFALYEAGEDPIGDVYIGYEQALRQAVQLGVGAEAELCRLAVHGTLHVLGYDHPPGEERLNSDMWQLQERILAEL